MGKRDGYTMVPEDDPQWMRFWDRFPKRESKKEARKAWAKLNPSPVLVDKMLCTLAWQIPYYRWEGEKYEWCPLPATWINKARYDDHPPPQAKQKVMGDAAASVFAVFGIRNGDGS